MAIRTPYKVPIMMVALFFQVWQPILVEIENFISSVKDLRSNTNKLGFGDDNNALQQSKRSKS